MGTERERPSLYCIPVVITSCRYTISLAPLSPSSMQAGFLLMDVFDPIEREDAGPYPEVLHGVRNVTELGEAGQCRHPFHWVHSSEIIWALRHKKKVRLACERYLCKGSRVGYSACKAIPIKVTSLRRKWSPIKRAHRLSIRAETLAQRIGKAPIPETQSTP